MISSGKNFIVCDDTGVEQFLGTHPLAKTFLTTQRMPVSYSTTNYFGVNSFKSTNGRNQTHFVRSRFIKEDGENHLSPEQIVKEDKNFLQTEIKNRIGKGAIINPGHIPDGIAIADPMLEIRTKAYPISLKGRQ